MLALANLSAPMSLALLRLANGSFATRSVLLPLPMGRVHLPLPMGRVHSESDSRLHQAH
jgi:hypothetical protein